jgi:hypothetical protein
MTGSAIIGRRPLAGRFDPDPQTEVSRFVGEHRAGSFEPSSCDLDKGWLARHFLTMMPKAPRFAPNGSRLVEVWAIRSQNCSMSLAALRHDGDRGRHRFPGLCHERVGGCEHLDWPAEGRGVGRSRTCGASALTRGRCPGHAGDCGRRGRSRCGDGYSIDRLGPPTRQALSSDRVGVHRGLSSRRIGHA